MARTLAAAAVLMMICGLACADDWDAPMGPNLATNPGFEEAQDGRPVGWGANPEVYTLDDNDPRTGEHCLKYVNSDPERYVLCSQPIKLEAGAIYEMEVWVRTEGVVGDDTGASICAEWADADGKWLGGSYAGGFKGDNADWQRLVVRTRPVPAEAASCSFKCYVRKGMTGTAWWDDASVRRVRRRPMETLLASPRYRGWIRDDGPDSVEVRTRFTWDDVPGGAQACRLVMSLHPREGDNAAERMAQEVVGDLPADELWVRLPLPELQPDKYDLDIAIVRKDTGEEVYATTHSLQRRTGPMPRCWIDDHNRLISDGEPFFPLGMYWGSITEDDLKIYTEGPLNCIMPYSLPGEEQLDLAQRYGIRVIYSIKDFYHGTRWCPGFIQSVADEEPKVREYVQRFRDHPALMGWYLNDELPLSMRDRLEAHQRWVEEEDESHPTWVVLYQVDQVASYTRTFNAIGTDPYPVGHNRPLSMAADWTRLTREAVSDRRALWMVPQAFQWRDADRRPTRDEMRSMAWQCICEGADGLIFYSWSSIRRDTRVAFDSYWADMKAVGEEIKGHIPALLSIELTPEMTVVPSEHVHSTVRTLDGVTWLFMVNDGDQVEQVPVRLDRVPTAITMGGETLHCSPEGELIVTIQPLGLSVVELRM